MKKLFSGVVILAIALMTYSYNETQKSPLTIKDINLVALAGSEGCQTNSTKNVGWCQPNVNGQEYNCIDMNSWFPDCFSD